MRFFPRQHVPGGHQVVGIGVRRRAHVDDDAGQDEPLERDRGRVGAALRKVGGRVQVGAAVFGGRKLFRGVEVAAGCRPLGERVELEARGVGGPVERAAAVGVAQVHHLPAGHRLRALRDRRVVRRRARAGGKLDGERRASNERESESGYWHGCGPYLGDATFRPASTAAAWRRSS